MLSPAETYRLHLFFFLGGPARHRFSNILCVECVDCVGTAIASPQPRGWSFSCTAVDRLLDLHTALTARWPPDWNVKPAAPLSAALLTQSIKSHQSLTKVIKSHQVPLSPTKVPKSHLSRQVPPKSTSPIKSHSSHQVPPSPILDTKSHQRRPTVRQIGETITDEGGWGGGVSSAGGPRRRR